MASVENLSEEATSMVTEEVYSYLGEWGTYQTRLMLLLTLPLVSKGMQTMMAVVAFHVPHHRCAIPGWPDDTYSIQSEDHWLAVNRTIPGGGSVDSIYSECNIFSNWNDSSDVVSNLTGHGDVESCSAWVYDTSEVDTSVVTQFNLVCDRKAYRAHINMVYFLGNFFGIVLTGYLCDWCGRKTVFFIINLLCLLVGILSTFPPNVEAFLVYRFLLGAAGTGVYMSAFVLLMELVGPDMRTRAASLVTLAWLAGPFILVPISFAIREWAYINIISVAPLVLCLGHWWLLPESPRWLLTKNRPEEALKIMQKVATVNKTPPPTSLQGLIKCDQDHATKPSRNDILRIVLQLIKYPRMLVITLIVFFNWFVATATYYGLSLNVGNLGGRLRINFLLSTTVELAGYLVAWVLLERWGRKRSHCCFMVVCGLALMATIFTVSLGGPELEWATTALAMVGKLWVSATFSCIYLISAEVFPTTIRNFSMACSSACGRMGSMVSPYIADLTMYVGGPFGRAMPLVVFGGLAFLAGISSFILPETLHRTLPDTLEEAVDFVKKRTSKKDKNKDSKPEVELDEMGDNSLLPDANPTV